MEAKKGNRFFLIVLITIIAAQFLLPKVLHILNVSYIMSSFLLEVIALLIPSLIYLKVRKKSFKETLRINPISIQSILILILVVILSEPIMAFLNVFSQCIFHNYVSDSLNMMKGVPYLALLGVVAITPAICEETVMRGIILSNYKKVDIKIAAIMNGFLFGLFHLGPQQFFYAFALGVIFAYLVEITNSIFSSMFCHFLINGFSVTLTWLVMKFNIGATQKNADFSTQPLNVKLTYLIFLFVLVAIFTPLLVMVLKELDRVNGYRLNKRKLAIAGNITKEKVMTWHIYLVMLLYVAFLVVVTLLGGNRV